jgi:hypothetical protein
MKVSIILALVVILFANKVSKPNLLLDPTCDITKIPAGQVSWEKVPYLDIINRQKTGWNTYLKFNDEMP